MGSAMRSGVLALMLLCAGGVTAAEQPEDAVTATEDVDDTTLIQESIRPRAEQGDAGSQWLLGYMYSEGRGVPQDYVQAADWHRQAAEQGDASAQNNLGRMYAEGWGVSQNHVQAHLWYNLAAASGKEMAVKNRDLVAAKMTPVQIAEAQKLAREWKSKPEAK